MRKMEGVFLWERSNEGEKQAKKTPQEFLATIHLLCHNQPEKSNCLKYRGAYQGSGSYAAAWACASQYAGQECSRNTHRNARKALRSVTFQRMPGPLIRAAVSCFPALSIAPEPIK